MCVYECVCVETIGTTWKSWFQRIVDTKVYIFWYCIVYSFEATTCQNHIIKIAKAFFFYFFFCWGGSLQKRYFVFANLHCFSRDKWTSVKKFLLFYRKSQSCRVIRLASVNLDEFIQVKRKASCFPDKVLSKMWLKF